MHLPGTAGARHPPGSEPREQGGWSSLMPPNKRVREALPRHRCLWLLKTAEPLTVPKGSTGKKLELCPPPPCHWCAGQRWLTLQPPPHSPSARCAAAPESSLGEMVGKSGKLSNLVTFILNRDISNDAASASVWQRNTGGELEGTTALVLGVPAARRAGTWVRAGPAPRMPLLPGSATLTPSRGHPGSNEARTIVR